MSTVTVHIKKPMYGNYVYINGSVVEKAIRQGSKLEIVVPSGRAIVDPKAWKENGKIMKKVFKFPDRPMILYGGNVPIPPAQKGEIITPAKQKAQQDQAKLF